MVTTSAAKPIKLNYGSQRFHRVVSALRADEPLQQGKLLVLWGASRAATLKAAETLAARLDKTLHRVDLGAIVSKYIGETEKNLDRLFDATEDSGVVLFFDEADALFGKRSEVKDSHDRYANLQASNILRQISNSDRISMLGVEHQPCRIKRTQCRFIHAIVRLTE